MEVTVSWNGPSGMSFRARTGSGRATWRAGDISGGWLTEDRSTPGDEDTIQVLIADDQALFRRGLYVVLGTEEHIEVVARIEAEHEQRLITVFRI